MKKLEKQHVERPVVKWARQRGVLVTKMKLLESASFPDDVFWLDGGRPLLIEFKAPGKKPSKLQQYTITKLRRLGYYVEVVDSVERGKIAIRETLARVDAVELPETCCDFPAGARRRRTISGAWTGKD